MAQLYFRCPGSAGIRHHRLTHCLAPPRESDWLALLHQYAAVGTRQCSTGIHDLCSHYGSWFVASRSTYGHHRTLEHRDRLLSDAHLLATALPQWTSPISPLAIPGLAHHVPAGRLLDYFPAFALSLRQF